MYWMSHLWTKRMWVSTNIHPLASSVLSANLLSLWSTRKSFWVTNNMHFLQLFPLLMSCHYSQNEALDNKFISRMYTLDIWNTFHKVWYREVAMQTLQLWNLWKAFLNYQVIFNREVHDSHCYWPVMRSM